MLKALKSAPISVPLLTAAIYILLALCGHFISVDTVGGSNIFLVIIIIQIIAFALPCFLYLGIKGSGTDHHMLKGRLSGNILLFSLATFFVLLFGSLLLQLLFYRGGKGLTYDKGYMDALFADDGGVGLFLSYCLVPAVCEELFFRGIVIGEYKRYGSLNAILISTLYFTLTHFTTSGFVIYMFAGLVLGFTAVVCRSVYPSMVLHICFNMYALYGNSAFVSRASYNTSTFFVGFVLFVVLLMMLALMFSRMEALFKAYSAEGIDRPMPEKSINHLYIYITPALIVPIAVFFLVNALL